MVAAKGDWSSGLQAFTQRLAAVATQERIMYNDMRSLNWSPGEKKIARKAFDVALRQELEEVIREAKQRAAKINEPSDLWKLEKYLYKRRNQIDEKYDYRYSVLPMVFGVLIREGRLREQDLDGLGEDKLRLIRSWAQL